MSINERIKQVRQAVGFTQTKFAERIAISTSYLAELELGDKPINERIIRLVSTEYGVDENWLRTGDGAMFSEESDARLAKLVSLFKSLNPRFQDCAIQQIAELSELCRQYME